MQAPGGHCTIELDRAPVGRGRHRVGTLRMLFDVDDKNRVIAILAARDRGA